MKSFLFTNIQDSGNTTPAGASLFSQRRLLMDLVRENPGHERKCMRSHCNNFGSIAAIGPDLLQSAAAGTCQFSTLRIAPSAP
jgi:hypothetical protein